MNTPPRRRVTGMLRVPAMAASTLLANASAHAFAQPVAERLEDRHAIAHVGRQVTQGGSVWGFEGPHELRWQFGFDATPLTSDAIPVMIALVNNGRPVTFSVERAPSHPVRVEMTLRRPNGSNAKETIEIKPNRLFLVNHAEPGAFLMGTVVDPRQHFGEMPPGAYHLRVRLIVPGGLYRSRDNHEIAFGVDATTPELRIEVIEREAPEAVPRSEPLTLVTGPIGPWPNQAGNLDRTVAAPLLGLDERLVIRADLWVAGGQKQPDDGVPPEDPVFAYPMLERWTDEGWVEPEAFGFCGTGMGQLSVKPGSTMNLQTPVPRGTDAGVYRFRFTAQTEGGAPVSIVTPAFTVPFEGGFGGKKEQSTGIDRRDARPTRAGTARDQATRFGGSVPDRIALAFATTISVIASR